MPTKKAWLQQAVIDALTKIKAGNVYEIHASVDRSVLDHDVSVVSVTRTCRQLTKKGLLKVLNTTDVLHHLPAPSGPDRWYTLILSEQHLETFLFNLIDADKEEFERALRTPFIRGIKTFEEDSIPSKHRGLIITTRDGSEFKVSIIKVSG